MTNVANKADFYVYQYIRAIASVHGLVGSPYYIGKGCGKRAYRKSDIEVRRPRDRSKILVVARNLLEVEAFELEKELIKLHGRIDLGTGCLRNKTDGGEGGSGAIRTAEMRWKMSSIRKGFKISEETKLKMSKARIGVKHSEETKQRMSAWQRGKPKGMWTDEARAKLSATTKGIPKSKEFKNKISDSNRRRVISEGSRAKISASLFGKIRSEESKAKQRATILSKKSVFVQDMAA